MISHNEYRIHYCRPGSLFDSSWMRAEDIDGFSLTDAEAQTMRVGVCLFPALAELEPKIFGDKPVLAELLVKSKVFFPSSAENQKFDPKKVIGKAVVLVS